MPKKPRTVELDTVLGSKKAELISDFDSKAAETVELLYAYYLQFQDKLELFSQLKDLIISVKSQIYDIQNRKLKELPSGEYSRLYAEVEKGLARLTEELGKVREIVSAEKAEEEKEESNIRYLLNFIEKKLPEKEISPKLEKSLKRMKAFLANAERKTYGVHHLLTLQLNLLEDITGARREADAEIKSNKKRLVRTLRILELEIMRLGKYLKEESEIIKHPLAKVRKFKDDLQALRSLGLVYSEPELNRQNLEIVTTRIRSDGKIFYGAKGIGIIHPDDTVEARFVKGGAEKHSEVVQMLLEGMAGAKLADEIAIKAYLLSLPLDRITRIAGYELQLEFNQNNELKIVNIDYASTILEVQMERKELHGEFISISKKDFERLNYAVLFSIDKELLDQEKFKMNTEKRGNKIHVTDRRIYPLRGEG